MAQRLSTCHTNVNPGIQIPELTWNVKYQVGMAAHSIYLRRKTWGIHSWLAKRARSARCGFARETLHQRIRREVIKHDSWCQPKAPHTCSHTGPYTYAHIHKNMHTHNACHTSGKKKNTWWNLSQEGNNYGLLKVSFKSSVVSQCSSYTLFISSMYITK